MRLTMVLLAAVLFASPADAAPLDAYAWKNRLMIIFAPALQDWRLIDQRELNVHAIEGLKDRDMVIFAVAGENRINAELGPAPEIGGAALRQRFGVADDDFAIILVGKDGTEKYRAAEPVDLAVIFDIVDGMPMRRREMRDQRT